jgi:hypothetical protein
MLLAERGNNIGVGFARNSDVDASDFWDGLNPIPMKRIISSDYPADEWPLLG